MIVTALVVALLQGGVAPVRAPVVTARVTPEQPAIGEPITVELRVRAAAGADVRFPVLPDTGTRIEPLDPRALSDASSETGLDRTARYRLIAWDTGTVTLAFGDVTVLRDGAEQRYPVTLAPLRIRSVLPADTALRVPKPARAPEGAASLRWRLWVALAVIAALAAWGWRRYRRARSARAVEGPDSLAAAREALAYLRGLRLAEAGEPGRHLLAHVEVLRRYLDARWPIAAAHLTARELAERLPGSDFPILPERVLAVVTRAEAVAYAQATIAPAEAEALAQEAAAIVEDLDQVWQARTDAARRAAEQAKRRRRRP